MGKGPSVEDRISQLLASDPRYREEAYRFVSQAVEYTVKKLQHHRHVSAEELLYGAREFAREQFGAVADNVLHSWGLKSCSDFGNVVYLMISVELLSASPGDRREDFDIVLVPAPEVKVPKRIRKIDC